MTKRSETKLVASILKQDQNAQKAKQNAILIRHHKTGTRQERSESARERRMTFHKSLLESGE